MTDSIADTGSPPGTADAAPLDTIRQWGQELGFQGLGFTGIDLAQHRDYLAKWLGAGFHEDGLQSGLAVAEALGAPGRPWACTGGDTRIPWTQAPAPVQPALAVAAE